MVINENVHQGWKNKTKQKDPNTTQEINFDMASMCLDEKPQIKTHAGAMFFNILCKYLREIEAVFIQMQECQRMLGH